MRKLYKVHVDYGRNGALNGLFVMDELEYQARLRKGTMILWHEELGKHSECDFEFNDTNVVEVTDDQNFIEKAEALGILPHGFDMAGYLEDADERAMGECSECGAEAHEDELDEHDGMCSNCADVVDSK